MSSKTTSKFFAQNGSTQIEKSFSKAEIKSVSFQSLDSTISNVSSNELSSCPNIENDYKPVNNIRMKNSSKIPSIDRSKKPSNSISSNIKTNDLSHAISLLPTNELSSNFLTTLPQNENTKRDPNILNKFNTTNEKLNICSSNENMKSFVNLNDKCTAAYELSESMNKSNQIGERSVNLEYVNFFRYNFIFLNFIVFQLRCVLLHQIALKKRLYYHSKNKI